MPEIQSPSKPTLSTPRIMQQVNNNLHETYDEYDNQT